MKRVSLKLSLLFAACLWLGGLRAKAAAPDCSDLIAKSEKLWLDGNYSESDKILDSVISKCPTLAAPYWRKARNIFDRIDSTPVDRLPHRGDLEARFDQMIALADKCIDLEPANGCCWEYKGIGLGQKLAVANMLFALRQVDEVEKIFHKAESLRPDYRSVNGRADALGDIYDALGRFYRMTIDSKLMKKMSGVQGDLGKSVKYMRKALALEPNKVTYNLQLGVSLICYGYRDKEPAAVDEGKKYLEKVAELPVVKYSDPEEKVHARVLLRHPELACSYKREDPDVIRESEFEKSLKK